MAGKAGVGRRPTAGDYREDEGIQNGGVRRGIPGGGYCLLGCPGQAFLEMQLNRPMPRGGKQCVGKPLLPIGLQ